MDTTLPKYVLVEDHIKTQIKRRKIIDKLPGERTLAKELGYSYMTIRKAIENLVDEGILYKVPTKGAFVANRQLNSPKTRTIGYFLDSRIAGGLSSPYYSLIFNAIEKETALEDYSLVYFTDSNQSNLGKILKKMDGVIASSYSRVEDFIQEIKQSVPVVAIDNSPSDKSIPSVIIDNFSAEAQAVQHLISLGHERIGFMTGLEDSDVGRNRYEGYKNGLARQGIEADQTLVFRGNYTFGSGCSGAEYFLSLEERPTAIVCANDSMALGTISSLHKAGLKVPEDLSVVGFDDINIASQITPALTTIVVPVDQIAKLAFTMLKRLIDGKSLENKHIALEAQLVVRDSIAEVTAETAVA